MKARDIMTTKVVTIDSLATAADAIATMQKYFVRSLIIKPNHPGDDYGIVTETDIVFNILATNINPENILVYQIMTKPCIAVSPDLSLKGVARLFVEHGIEKAPVIQKDLLGMISATDMIMKLKVAANLDNDDLSKQINREINHNRVAPNYEEQVAQECKIAWDIIEKNQPQ